MAAKNSGGADLVPWHPICSLVESFTARAVRRRAFDFGFVTAPEKS